MAYQPIENYGIIGDLHTVALVGRDGSIDWFCFPHFDSPSVFAAILDDAKGGRFRIAPAKESATHKQFYWPETNVLITRGGQQHFVYSKLMCWVAIDRALRLAEKRSFPADWQRWLEVRDKIYEKIMSRGWSRDRQAFVQHYGSRSLDAANLMMPLVFFLVCSRRRLAPAARRWATSRRRSPTWR